MSAVFPQSISQSLIPLPLRASTNYQDPLLYVERQAKHIQRNLQHLIDAQSEGLLAGLGGQQPGGSLNESYSFLSGPPSPRGASTVPIRQPPRKKIGLRSAREGIFTSMYDLMRLREEELEIIVSRQEEMNSGLNEIDAFNTKRSGLEKAILTINGERNSQRSMELKDESSRLQAQIHEMENTLAQKKAKHRQAVLELSQIENSVESKLSSYKASLSLLESDIRRFLADPPVRPPGGSTNRENFYSLKSNRRTLEMAQEHWKRDRFALQQRQKEVDAEIEALEEGGELWKQAVGDISAFEGRLRTAMRRSMQTRDQLLPEDGLSYSKSSLAHDIVQELAQTTDLVEQHLDYAERRNWKLLVCCISAELQALREAREMLLSAFNITEEEIAKGASKEHPKSMDDDSQRDPLAVDNPDPPADLLHDIKNYPHETDRSEDDGDDDEPDPAWLLPEV
ncbi:hypothetical protein BDW62DRAFT_172663 [Aspergillus aurantiobrunneus]